MLLFFKKEDLAFFRATHCNYIVAVTGVLPYDPRVGNGIFKMRSSAVFDHGKKPVRISRSWPLVLFALEIGSCAPQEPVVPPTHILVPFGDITVDFLVELPFNKGVSVFAFADGIPRDVPAGPGTYGLQRIPAGDVTNGDPGTNPCLNCGSGRSVSENMAEAKEILALSQRLFQAPTWTTSGKGWTVSCVKISVTLPISVESGIVTEKAGDNPPSSTLTGNAAASCNGKNSGNPTIVLFLPDAGANVKAQQGRYVEADKTMAAAE